MKTALSQRFDAGYLAVPESGCWLWERSRNACGYGTMRADGSSKLAHRVSWVLHRGEIPKGLCVLHHCDTPACVNPDHLSLGTPKDNAQDKERKGRGGKRGTRGELSGAAKITESQAVEIRVMRAAGARLKPIAAMFGISESSVSMISRGKNWGHVDQSVVPIANGERHYHAKLTDVQVRAIRADSRKSTVIAPEYGVCARYVRALKSGMRSTA